MRKLASIQRVLQIDPIKDADKIEVCTINGWKVVTRKNEFNVGDLVVYFEIDSFIPINLAPFLGTGKSFNGKMGNVLRTVKLRGQISQGLIMPLSILPDGDYKEGDDVTDILGIIKYEKPVPFNSNIKGLFPTHLFPKTDQERVQNIKIEDIVKYNLYEVTEKLDGMSITIFKHNDEVGACSRNYELKYEDNNILKELVEKIESVEYNYAIQGELIGPKIQGNRYNHKTSFFVYDIFDITEQKYLNFVQRHEFCEKYEFNHVPFIEAFEPNKDLTIDKLLKYAEGKSKLNPDKEREGVVFKNPDFSFKVISNKFLLKG